METQTVALQRRDVEHLLRAAGNAGAIEQLATTENHTALIVVVLANSDQNLTPATDGLTHLAAVERIENSTAPQRREALAHRRREICMTQEGLARDVGVQRSTVARWESGDTTPSLWARPRIANALGVTLDRLDQLLVTSHTELDQPQTSSRDVVGTAIAPRPPAVA